MVSRWDAQGFCGVRSASVRVALRDDVVWIVLAVWVGCTSALFASVGDGRTLAQLSMGARDTRRGNLRTPAGYALTHLLPGWVGASDKREVFSIHHLYRWMPQVFRSPGAVQEEGHNLWNKFLMKREFRLP